MMNELERVLVSDSAAAPADRILEGVGEELAHRQIAGSPRTIHGELWHIAFWQQITLEWIDGIETAYPEHASSGFPAEQDIDKENWDSLCRRFFAGVQQAAAATRDPAKLEQVVRCPSPPGAPVRTMTVREQLESLAAHNAYHFGRIVLLRQMSAAWPPASGGSSW
jgi:uncharacterized damage-inducible protein DinB